ncbi:hypothetical protein MMC09_006847 [Bachmanniomyces sp. S44760]|nr:hypothetical protein [Bachmanniomyces sp. S44760]
MALHGKRKRDDFEDKDLKRRRDRNDSILKSRFESIFEKYGKDFGGVGDEIDIGTGRIVINNGHLMSMRNEGDIVGTANEPDELRSCLVQEARMDGLKIEEDDVRPMDAHSHMPDLTQDVGSGRSTEIALEEDINGLLGTMRRSIEVSSKRKAQTIDSQIELSGGSARVDPQSSGLGKALATALLGLHKRIDAMQQSTRSHGKETPPSEVTKKVWYAPPLPESTTRLGTASLPIELLEENTPMCLSGDDELSLSRLGSPEDQSLWSTLETCTPAREGRKPMGRPRGSKNKSKKIRWQASRTNLPAGTRKRNRSQDCSLPPSVQPVPSGSVQPQESKRGGRPSKWVVSVSIPLSIDGLRDAVTIGDTTLPPNTSKAVNTPIAKQVQETDAFDSRGGNQQNLDIFAAPNATLDINHSQSKNRKQSSILSVISTTDQIPNTNGCTSHNRNQQDLRAFATPDAVPILNHSHFVNRERRHVPAVTSTPHQTLQIDTFPSKVGNRQGPGVSAAPSAASSVDEPQFANRLQSVLPTVISTPVETSSTPIILNETSGNALTNATPKSDGVGPKGCHAEQLFRPLPQRHHDRDISQPDIIPKEVLDAFSARDSSSAERLETPQSARSTRVVPCHWTAAEETLLMHLKRSTTLSDEELEKVLPGRSAMAIHVKWNLLIERDAPLMQSRPMRARRQRIPRTGPYYWTTAEETLLKHFKRNTTISSTELERYFPERTAKAIRTHVDDMRQRDKPWSREEDDLLRKLRNDLGLKFCQMTERFPGRKRQCLIARWSMLSNEQPESYHRTVDATLCPTEIEALINEVAKRRQPMPGKEADTPVRRVDWTQEDGNRLLNLQDNGRSEFKSLAKYSPTKTSIAIESQYPRLKNLLPHESPDLVSAATDPGLESDTYVDGRSFTKTPKEKDDTTQPPATVADPFIQELMGYAASDAPLNQEQAKTTGTQPSLAYQGQVRTNPVEPQISCQVPQQCRVGFHETNSLGSCSTPRPLIERHSTRRSKRDMLGSSNLVDGQAKVSTRSSRDKLSTMIFASGGDG